MNQDFLHSMFADLLGDLHDPGVVTHVVWQVATLAVAMGLAWVIVRLLGEHLNRLVRGSAEEPARGGAEIGAAVRALLAWLLVAAANRVALSGHEHAPLLRIAAVLLLAAGVLRLVSYAVGRVFKPSELLLLIQRGFAGLVFLAVALHVTGLLPDVLDALEIPIYSSSDMPQALTLLALLRDGCWILIALVVALWAGAVLDARLMKIESIDASLRVALARFARAVLLVLAVLVAMNGVGIPLGILSVFGGALGVGLGLGLQRIASNYVSGFIILLDRSLRIGDLISVDKYHGAVTQIRTRYTVIQALDGTEAIIPNELLVSGTVTNHSFTSKQLRITVKIQIAYNSDLERAMAVMLEAARAQPRVLEEPAPLVTLNGFGADGLDLELGFWLDDPERGTNQTRSDISRAILAGFTAAGISIPYPQREVRLWTAPGEIPDAAARSQEPFRNPPVVPK